MRTLPIVVGLLLLVAGFLLPFSTSADGVVVVEPPVCEEICPRPVMIGDLLIVKRHLVDVTINDQIATTRIDQTFLNPNEWDAEGTYLFPVPPGVTVDHFTMTVDGEEIEARILTAEEARQIYEDIVRSMRDPALLEYAGRNMIQARIFPIPPGGERQVEISYDQVLTAQDGLINYVYPLSTEQFSAAPIEQVSVRVSISSAQPVRAIYSPSHQVVVDRSDDHHLIAGWEAINSTRDTDFSLIYTVSPDDIGLNLLTEWDEAAGEGTFLLLAAPGIEAATAPIAKDVILVLDTSGSMEGEKIEQARAAVQYVLGHLNDDDRFAVIEFSTGVRLFHSDLLPAHLHADASDWVGSLLADGGTDINRALLEAMSLVQSERPTYLLFVTDGIPTEGETDSADILANVERVAPDNVRLFSFGVGFDVDTYLLDLLADENQGTSDYVIPGERLDEVISSFYSKVSAPVMTDLALAIDGVPVEEIYPQPLPDLFAGGQLVVAGRYREGGSGTLTLRGLVNGEPVEIVQSDQPFAVIDESSSASLARLWATRKIGYLLQQIRLNGEGEELIQAIVELSVRYGIVTPYTSYLITDADVLTVEGRQAAAATAYEDAQAAAPMTSGEGAVNYAEASGAMAQADSASGPVAPEISSVVQIVDDRTFVLQEEVWIDTRYDPAAQTTRQVTFLSDDYFELVAAQPDLAAAFALGERVIALDDGIAWEVVAA